jgi:hypothetical protein
MSWRQILLHFVEGVEDIGTFQRLLILLLQVRGFGRRFTSIQFLLDVCLGALRRYVYSVGLVAAADLVCFSELFCFSAHVEVVNECVMLALM